MAYFCGLPACAIAKLQYVQNMAARIIFRLSKSDHISDSLKELHWLPVRFRIDFKILCMVFKCTSGNAPMYLQNMIVLCNSRNTRSGSGISLFIPRTKTKWGDRSFCVYGPRLWNTLPRCIRDVDDYLSFRKAVKTHLFRLAFPGDS